MNKRATWYAVTISVLMASSALAVELPGGSERRPNLSLDPFERAREAVKKLPSQATDEPVREQRREEPVAPVTAQPESAGAEQVADSGEEPAAAFTQEIVITADAFKMVQGGYIPGVLDPEEPAPPTIGTPLLVEYAAEVDTGAATLWDNGTFFFHAMFAAGTSSGDIIGDFHGLSNIDMGSAEDGSYQTFHILEAWYQHSFEHSHSSVLIGLHDWNSEFYVAEYAGLFINGAFGMGAALGAVAGPSSYPSTSVGVRFATELTEKSYFQIGMYDGTPGDPTEVINLSWTPDEGVFVGAEAGLTDGEPGEPDYYKIALGAWYLRAPIEDYAGNGDELTYQVDPPFSPQPGINGAYFIAETSVGDNLGVFFMAGWADPLYARYSNFYAGGVSYKGLMPGRVDDVFGVGIVHTRHGANFLENTAGAEGPIFFTYENAIEITYSAQINDWLMVQPDFQYIQQPAMSPDINDSMFVGLRVQIVY